MTTNQRTYRFGRTEYVTDARGARHLWWVVYEGPEPDYIPAGKRVAAFERHADAAAFMQAFAAPPAPPEAPPATPPRATPETLGTCDDYGCGDGWHAGECPANPANAPDVPAPAPPQGSSALPPEPASGMDPEERA